MDENTTGTGGFKQICLFPPRFFLEEFQFDYIIFFRWVETTNQNMSESQNQAL